MGISNFHSNEPDKFDQIQALMCSVYQCQNRWCVKMDGDKPKCSDHQWVRAKPKMQTPVPHWQDEVME
jgi:hypothetical protein